MVERSKILSIALTLIMVLALFTAGCASNDEKTAEGTGDEGSTGAEEAAQAEQINVKGSTTVLPLAQAAAETYMANHPEASISISGGGSGTGIAALIDGDVDIAMASRKMKDSEIENAEANGIDPVEHVIAWDGLTVVVNPANPVDQLTYDQIKGIYDGSISNWKDVGGPDKEIVVINRDSSSGTYGYFQEEILGEDNEFREDAISTSSNGAVLQSVSQNDAAIGYIGFAYLTDIVDDLCTFLTQYKVCEVSCETGGLSVCVEVKWPGKWIVACKYVLSSRFYHSVTLVDGYTFYIVSEVLFITTFIINMVADRIKSKYKLKEGL